MIYVALIEHLLYAKCYSKCFLYHFILESKLMNSYCCYPSFVCFSTNLHYRQHIGLSHLMLCRIRRECSSGQPCDSDHLVDP